MFLSTLESLMQLAKTNKQNADDAEKARHWALVYTGLESVYALVKTFLVEESE